MRQFSKKIDSEDSKLEFHFEIISTKSGAQYHISVMNKSLKWHYFIMQEINRNWTFLGNKALPQWILELESQLQQGITDHLSGIKPTSDS